MLRTFEAKSLEFCRFPFFAADVLASNAMILQALLEGGWSNEEEQADKEKSTEDTEPNESIENPLVSSIMKGTEE